MISVWKTNGSVDEAFPSAFLTASFKKQEREKRQILNQVLSKSTIVMIFAGSMALFHLFVVLGPIVSDGIIRFTQCSENQQRKRNQTNKQDYWEGFAAIFQGLNTKKE